MNKTLCLKAATVLVFAVLILTVRRPPVLAQSLLDPLRTKGAQIGLQESPGPIPVFYVAATKERALAFQTSLAAGFDWFQKQLGVRPNTALFVLDEPARKVLGVAGGAHSSYSPALSLIFMDEGSAQALGVSGHIAGADPLHDIGGPLVFEPVLFHEAGHVFAFELKIPTGNSSFMSELIANTFQVAYLRAGRRDLGYSLANIRAGTASGVIPRYTTWADFEYLGYASTMSFPSLRPDRSWFQGQLSGIADGLLDHVSFSTVIERLQKEFAGAAMPRQMSPDAIQATLKRIDPDFKPPARLFGPTTITPASPTACEESKPVAGIATPILVIRNDTDDLISVTPVSADRVPVTIQPHAWAQVTRVGATYRLPDGRCVTVLDEPTIAVVSK